MEKNRNERILGLVAVIISVISIGIAFATLNTPLTINGTGTVKASSWKVRFVNLRDAELAGTAEENTAPSINTNDTNIGDYKVTLKAPGDSATYKFDVKNEGTFDAEITSLTVPTPTCTGTGDNATNDQTNVCKNVTYKLVYENGDAVKTTDTLNANETKTMKLVLEYDGNTPPEELPKEDVSLTQLGVTITYSQK